MLKKRIIPCLDIHDGRTVKGVNFVSIRDAGDPVELARAYVRQSADELVFLDITATVDKRKTLVPLVRRIGREINIPFSVGGGVSSVEDVGMLLDAGADKVCINSAAVKRPGLISDLAANFGSQCVVVAIDTDLIDGDWKVVVHGGRTPTEYRTLDWAKHAALLGAGEILLTSMKHDGTKQGFAVNLIDEVCNAVNIPVIASGGAGSIDHFTEVFTKTSADAALAASVFHFGEIPIPLLKQQLKEQNIPVRWK